MRFVVAAACWLVLAASTPACAQLLLGKPPAENGQQALPGQVALSQMVIDMRPGESIGTIALWACWTPFDVTWDGGERLSFTPQDLESAFRDEMRRRGISVVNVSLSSADQSATGPDLVIEAHIQKVWGDFCAPKIGDKHSVRGVLDMTVEWSLYSRSRKGSVGSLTTRGRGAVGQATPGSFRQMAEAALRDSVVQLVQVDGFAALARARPNEPPHIDRPTGLPTIIVKGPKPPRPIVVRDAVGSVVVISNGEVMGSGFLISSEGYFLTDQHVVGDAKLVRVRWPDGFEEIGEVVRSHKGRDVALVKADPRGHPPLAIRLTPIQPGDVVYAVGAPLDEKYEGSVTQGVASAYRTFEGLEFIQSDVAVTHGNSGGPLLDKDGAVIGLTESGVEHHNAPMGINLFTPIRDALDFVGAATE